MSQTVQDLPPAGGFPETIKYQRFIPKRGPTGLVMFAVTFGIMGYGWYWLTLSNAERREHRREKAWSRISLVPLLQAETDRDLVRRFESLKNQEYEIMKEAHPDWQPVDLKAPVRGIGKDAVRDPEQSEPVYHTSRYVAPSMVYLPEDEKSTSQSIPAQWWRGSKMFLTNPPFHNRSDWKGKKFEDL
ncbi:GRIM-19 protein-domain-containing protein [Polychytrium aggregatum]|uniref:GRIM-19 protein-domain-containing protein n=1 Tax=Polychytrium aggregatum TaxID=110093 RepID=UPI0022FE3AD7|nr:GRIM-19 protein-domain-containing protein [Polychytrium aggregatum]KAI9203184.1 GRIM-19 protein-domain-containing protein [Polychytrium aggregatum]